MKKVLFVSSQLFLFSTAALADSNGTSALDIVKNMNLKDIREKAEAEELKEQKERPLLPSHYKVSPDNPHYKQQIQSPGQAPFLQTTDYQ